MDITKIIVPVADGDQDILAANVPIVDTVSLHLDMANVFLAMILDLILETIVCIGNMVILITTIPNHIFFPLLKQRTLIHTTGTK
jgi:hypothetical protein